MFTPLLAVYGAAALIILLIAYWRTLWVGKTCRVPVALCSVLNSGSLVALVLLAGDVWSKRTLLSFGLLAAAAAGYLLTEWWSLRLKRQQEQENGPNKDKKEIL